MDNYKLASKHYWNHIETTTLLLFQHSAPKIKSWQSLGLVEETLLVQSGGPKFKMLEHTVTFWRRVLTRISQQQPQKSNNNNTSGTTTTTSSSSSSKTTTTTTTTPTATTTTTTTATTATTTHDNDSNSKQNDSGNSTNSSKSNSNSNSKSTSNSNNHVLVHFTVGPTSMYTIIPYQHRSDTQVQSHVYE